MALGELTVQHTTDPDVLELTCTRCRVSISVHELPGSGDESLEQFLAEHEHGAHRKTG